MPDRSLRRPPLLLRERRPSPTSPRESDDVPESGQATTGGQGSGAPTSGERPEPPRTPETPSGTPSDDNPFAPPPEGTPDRPWRPRRPSGGGRGQDGPSGQDGGGTPPWGSQWSDRQPGPAQGGRFGDKPGAGNSGGSGGGRGGPEGSGGPGAGMRWDPTDPAQRRARFALLSGMWAFFFALFNWPYVALLLGALALHWAISALRAKPRTPDPDSPAPPPQGSKPQTTAAISGLVTASLALALVAMTFTAQLVYRDYYTCVNDSLTKTAEKSCDDLLPDQLQGLLGTRD